MKYFFSYQYSTDHSFGFGNCSVTTEAVVGIDQIHVIERGIIVDLCKKGKIVNSVTILYFQRFEEVPGDSEET